MIKITKPTFQKALIAGFFSAFTIGVLTVLTYKSTLGYFIAGSFGSSMVLLFGFPESPFAQPKNVFFGHLCTALVGVIFVNLVPLPIYINIALGVGAGVFFMILLNIVHPPAGGNPIIVIIGSASYDYLISPIIFGCIIIISLAILINKFFKLLKGKIKIIGVGGVDSGQAAYDKFLAGADFIQLYTGMVFKGPNIAGIIKKDLKDLLLRDGVKNFTEIIGNKTLS